VYRRSYGVVTHSVITSFHIFHKMCKWKNF